MWNTLFAKLRGADRIGSYRYSMPGNKHVIASTTSVNFFSGLIQLLFISQSITAETTSVHFSACKTFSSKSELSSASVMFIHNPGRALSERISETI